MSDEEIRVQGIVQGVGFRPTVYRLAKACGLTGNVCNDGEGVLIRVSGKSESIAEFVQRLQQECPPLAKIEAIIRNRYLGSLDRTSFTIYPSLNSTIHTLIAPDAATCPQCQEETLNPLTRWYLYPFTNCTHCGPRLSIIRAVPYDRNNTSMANFPMCSDCAEEYKNVENRRFHAQPIACHTCGPKAWLEGFDGQKITNFMLSTLNDVDEICNKLKAGFIIAIKGIGGIHLAADATQEVVVQKLRNRKQRDRKPLALMARDMAMIEEYCTPNALESELLTSAAAPIVLLNITGKKPVSPSIAPGQNTLGFMLPYTPLHHLIMQQMEAPIILTSGNIADEPQCIDNQEAREKLGKIVDYFLLHNRDIVNRVDDSVMQVVNNRPQVLRRARGIAPAPIILPLGFEKTPEILAMGGELKNTFCLLRDGKAILSQHLGDLENAAAFNSYGDTLNLYLSLFEQKPEIIAVDLHPEYLSTKFGKELAENNNLPLYSIQHHHAHIAACMAENGMAINTPPVLGIALDGLGYGEDGKLWGGEFLLADYRGFTRLGMFKSVAMIGGKQAIYQPWRNTYSHLMAAFDWDVLKRDYGDLELIAFLDRKPRQILNQMLEKGINSPVASSCGRLFDGVAAAIGICREESSYEGQAAIEMSAIVDVNILNNDEEIIGYPFAIGIVDTQEQLGTGEVKFNVLNVPKFYLEPQPMWEKLLADLQANIPQSVMAAKFHKGLGNAIANLVFQLRCENVINCVVITGGVFQNRILLERVSSCLERAGIRVLTHSLVPPNDGGISLGQAAIAAAKILK
ncbi:carbamoyltransferase HypF [Oscillatoriales cyanobacterium USR001]|nr:carbamoyltransferase HypF [Oscillatoriales cyanobacterium USR001]